MLLLARAQILRRNVHNAVRVDIERHLNLRNAARRRGDAVQMEGAQRFVVARKFALALQHIHLNGGLIVGGGGEDLALLGGDGGVAVDDLGAHAAHRLDAEAERGNVQQQQALHVAAQNAALNGGADGNALVRVDALAGLGLHKVFHGVLHGRNTRRAAHQQHLVQPAGRKIGVLQRLAHRAHRALHQVCRKLVELRARERGIQMLRAVGVRRDERQIDGRAGHAGKLDLRLLGGLLQALRGHFVAAQIHAVFLLELVGQPINDALVEIVAAEVRIARGGEHLRNAVAHLDDGDVERAAAKVVHHNLLIVLFIRAVGQRRGRRLVDDALYVQPRDGARVLCGLALAVVEIRRHGDNGLCYLLAQIALGVGLQLCKDHGADLLRGVLFAIDVHLVIGAHLALDGGNGAVGVCDSLTLCHLAHQTVARFGEAHNGRRGARALGVCNDNRLAAFNHGNAAVCCAKVDTNDLSHNNSLLILN